MRSEGDETKRVGVLRFMAYESGRRSVGQALLEKAEEEYARRAASEIAAFPKGYIYHFCSPEGAAPGETECQMFRHGGEMYQELATPGRPW